MSVVDTKYTFAFNEETGQVDISTSLGDSISFDYSTSLSVAIFLLQRLKRWDNEYFNGVPGIAPCPLCESTFEKGVRMHRAVTYCSFDCAQNAPINEHDPDWVCKGILEYQP
ncbi:MAG: hypothetical protein K2X93_17300 [Candidatus Obscuribacterales bacterium]|nr:hypothetical protein [Candidatus Obscuribacterales bacterium]